MFLFRKSIRPGISARNQNKSCYSNNTNESTVGAKKFPLQNLQGLKICLKVRKLPCSAISISLLPKSASLIFLTQKSDLPLEFD